MTGSQQRSLDDLPRAPGLRILRAPQAAIWVDAYRFLAEATAAADRIEESARAVYAAERARGQQEGRATGANEAAQLVSETVGKVDRYLASLEQDAAGIALQIVRRVLGEFDDAELVGRVAAQALREFRREKWLKITVHPDVADDVGARLAAYVRDDGPSLTIASDPDRARTSCVIASEVAVVDASLATQLDAIAAAFAHLPAGSASTLDPGAMP